MVLVYVAYSFIIVEHYYNDLVPFSFFLYAVVFPIWYSSCDLHFRATIPVPDEGKSVKPTCWNEECVPLFDRAFVAHIHLISKEHLILIR